METFAALTCVFDGTQVYNVMVVTRSFAALGGSYYHGSYSNNNNPKSIQIVGFRNILVPCATQLILSYNTSTP